MKNSKVCVYAICKNEMKFLDKWLDSMSEADYIVVLDTGSTDGSFEYLQEDPRCTKVEQKVIDPWRFDVARNESMKLVPEDTDIYVCTDPDELFQPGWCEPLKEAWVEGTTRCRYNYSWSHASDGSPQDVFLYDKIHDKNYYWKYPIHEVLWSDELEKDPEKEVSINLNDKIFLHHYQDLSVERRNYLDLLRVAVDENPGDAHIYHLFAREFYLQGDYETSKRLFYNLLRLPDAYNPRNIEVLLDTFCMQARLCVILNKSDEEVIYWCDQFLRITDTFREPYLMFADILVKQGDFETAENVLDAMYEKAIRHYSWVEKQADWLYLDKWLGSTIQFGLGRYDKALELIDECLKYEPNNVEMLQTKINCLIKLSETTET